MTDPVGAIRIAVAARPEVPVTINLPEKSEKTKAINAPNAAVEMTVPNLLENATLRMIGPPASTLEIDGCIIQYV